jgi:hypothetical protein
MSRARYATQGRIVIAELKRRPMTYRQMLNLGAGNSPWRRCMEALDERREKVIRSKGADGLTRWRVVAVR